MYVFQNWNEDMSQKGCALPKADVWSVVHQLQVAFSVAKSLGSWVSIFGWYLVRREACERHSILHPLPDVLPDRGLKVTQSQQFDDKAGSCSEVQNHHWAFCQTKWRPSGVTGLQDVCCASCWLSRLGSG